MITAAIIAIALTAEDAYKRAATIAAAANACREIPEFADYPTRAAATAVLLSGGYSEPEAAELVTMFIKVTAGGDPIPNEPGSTAICYAVLGQ